MEASEPVEEDCGMAMSSGSDLAADDELVSQLRGLVIAFPTLPRSAMGEARSEANGERASWAVGTASRLSAAEAGSGVEGSAALSADEAEPEG